MDTAHASTDTHWGCLLLPPTIFRELHTFHTHTFIIDADVAHNAFTVTFAAALAHVRTHVSNLTHKHAVWHTNVNGTHTHIHITCNVTFNQLVVAEWVMQLFPLPPSHWIIHTYTSSILFFLFVFFFARLPHLLSYHMGFIYTPPLWLPFYTPIHLHSLSF